MGQQASSQHRGALAASPPAAAGAPAPRTPTASSSAVAAVPPRGRRSGAAPPGAAPPSTRSGKALEGKAALLLLNSMWFGTAPPACRSDDAAAAQPCAFAAAAPAYDSDDETTDAAVVSALAMTDPAELRGGSYSAALSSSRASRQLRARTKGPILQVLLPPENDSRHTSPLTSPLPTPAASLPPSAQRLASAAELLAVQPVQPRYTPAFGQPGGRGSGSKADAAEAARHNRASTWRQRSAGSSSSSTRPQQSAAVPLSAAALRAAGMPCEIGGDLPPWSLQSHRASGADSTAMRPYTHLRMMQLHRQQQQQAAAAVAAQQRSVLCAQVSAWGWGVAGRQPGTPVATS